MTISEKELEDLICNNLHSISGLQELDKRGFPFNLSNTFVRQYSLGSYGIADVISYRLSKQDEWKSGYTAHIDIYELKKDEISICTLLQAIRYAKGCKRMIEIYNQINGKKWIEPQFNIYLIGKEVNVSNEFIFIPDIFPNIKLIEYKLSINGIYFQEINDYQHKKESISFPKSLKFQKTW